MSFLSLAVKIEGVVVDRIMGLHAHATTVYITSCLDSTRFFFSSSLVSVSKLVTQPTRIFTFTHRSVDLNCKLVASHRFHSDRAQKKNLCHF